MSRSPSVRSLSKRLFTTTSLAILVAMPITANAFALTPQSSLSNGSSISQGTNTHQWLIADKKDDKNDKKGRNNDRRDLNNSAPVRSVQPTRVNSFSTNQRTVLVDLLRGNCSCNNLLTSATRTQITNQSRSLPPGIQKQLLRGKGLPPGIAKKLVPLPKQVNTYLNLPTNYDLVVLGSNVLLVDQVKQVVVDYISKAIF